ncbi:MAG: cobalamin-dependent protein, partial [Candidatus Aenigmarchaeota archaeon]|nr:cobalamin-dependent protein [Candidatus Aenigmarchaeota archaeon]
SSLRRNNIDYLVCDSRISLGKGFITDKKELERLLLKGPNLVAITLCEDYVERVAELLRFIRSKSKAFILIGGPMATLSPEHVMAHLPEANMVIRGDGEEILPRIARVIGASDIESLLSEEALESLSTLDGLLFWNKGVLVCGNPAETNESDFNRNRPDFSFLERRDVEGGLFLFTSRGCRNNCIFCTTPGKGRFRARDAAKVKQDLDSYYRRILELFPEGIPDSAKVVSFNDDDFFTDTERASEIIDYFRGSPLKIGFLQGGINAFFDRTTGRLNKGIFESLSPDVFHRPDGRVKTDMYIGTESLNDEELANLEKGYTFDQVKEVVSELSARKIYQAHHLIISNPWTSMDNIRDTFRKALQLKGVHGDFFRILEPPITNMVSLYPSRSYRKIIREGKGCLLSKKK